MLFTNNVGGQTPTPESLRNAVVAALESKWIVAIGENHGHVELHKLLRDLLTDTEVKSVVDDIVVEFGNPLYQGAVDRFVSGGPVRYDSVRFAWRNTVVSPNTVWDSPVYEQFFQHIRQLNLRRDDGRQYRIVLAGSPVDWTKVTTMDDLRPFFDRSMAMATMIEREVLRQGRRALFIAGGAHLTRRNMVRNNKNGVPTATGSVVSRMALRHPETLFVIRSLAKGRGIDHDRLAEIPRGSLLYLSNSWLGSIPANSVSTMQNMDGSAFDAYGAATLGELVDAVIYWGLEVENHFAETAVTVYLNEDYWEELNRRSLLVRRRPIDIELRKTRD